MVSALISRIVILVFGTLYPAYKSYKAVRTKNVKEYVKWMMYWIVFALFTCVETFTDLFVAWLPFYYEIKICFVIWLMSPYTKGASILYRKFVHPQLTKREQDIDAQLEKVTDQGYTALVSLGHKGIQYATNVVVSTAIKGQATIAEQIKKSYSLTDVSTDESGPTNQSEKRREVDEYSDDDVDMTDNRLIEESYQQEMGEFRGDDVTQFKQQQQHEDEMRHRKPRSKEALLAFNDDLSPASLPSRSKRQTQGGHGDTLPRSKRVTRSSKNSSNRHSYHE